MFKKISSDSKLAGCFYHWISHQDVNNIKKNVFIGTYCSVKYFLVEFECVLNCCDHMLQIKLYKRLKYEMHFSEHYMGWVVLLKV